MIRIAIVDDEQQERNKLLRFFEQLQMKVREEVEVQLFVSGEQFLFEDDRNFDLICLDIDMNGRDGIHKQKISLKELEDRMEGLSFQRCNNCYLVNLKYVDCVNKDELRINGEWLKISRPRKKEFLQTLANYMGGIQL